MNMPYISGLRADVWSQQPHHRLDALQGLENYIANQEGRTPCVVDVKDLDSRLRGEHYFEDGIEHINLKSNIVDTSEPYQAVETLFHESRHSYQDHIVQHPDQAEGQELLQDCQMSKNGGYVSYPENTKLFSDYRFQPMELDAREVARTRTDVLYQDIFQDQTGYPSYKSQKEEEIANDIEYAKNEYQLDESLNQGEALSKIRAEARQAMVTKYESETLGMDAESVSSPPLSDSGSAPSSEYIARSAGQVAGNVAAGPAGGEVGKIVGETADKAQQEAIESTGQSTEDPVKINENAAQENPSDEEQNYGYGYGY